MHPRNALAAAYAPPAGVAVADDVPASVASPLYRAALGPLGSTGRYLAAFERFDATGRALPGWNAAAAFCTVGWMVLRRLWSPLLVYLAALVALAALLGALWSWGRGLPVPVLSGLTLALVLLAFALPGLYADALLHRHLQGRIAAAVAAAPTLREAMARLERLAPGRTRLMGVAAAVAVLGMLLAAALATIALGLERAHVWGPAPAAAVATPVAATAPAPAGQPMPAPERPATETAATQASVAAAPAASEPALEAPPSGVTQAPTPPASASASAAARGVQRAAPPPGDTAAPAPLAVAGPTTAAPAPRPEAPAVPPSRRLYINVGLFADPANARRAHARLTASGLPSEQRQVSAAGGRKLQRVRVGPFTSSAEANAAAARVRELGLDAAPAAE